MTSCRPDFAALQAQFGMYIAQQATLTRLYKYKDVGSAKLHIMRTAVDQGQPSFASRWQQIEAALHASLYAMLSARSKKTALVRRSFLATVDIIQVALFAFHESFRMSYVHSSISLTAVFLSIANEAVLLTMYGFLVFFTFANISGASAPPVPAQARSPFCVSTTLDPHHNSGLLWHLPMSPCAWPTRGSFRIRSTARHGRLFGRSVRSKPACPGL